MELGAEGGSVQRPIENHDLGDSRVMMTVVTMVDQPKMPSEGWHQCSSVDDEKVFSTAPVVAPHLWVWWLRGN